MKYRTVLELVCDAPSTEEASNLAGDYLKGEVDFGVEMKCKTVSLVAHNVKKYTVCSIIAALIFSTLLLKVTPLGGEEKICNSSRIGFRGTYTVTPALKTKHKADFKKEWLKRKEEAVLDYIKK